MTTAGALAAAVRAGLRPIAACALIGALAGIIWGLAGDPEYAATATVIVNDRGDAAETAGNGAVGGSSPDATERLLEVARSDDVSELAAAGLGGDVAGADLLSMTEFRTGDRGGTLVVRSVAGFPDYAAATANAYASAIVEEAGALEKRRLRRAADGLEEDLAAVDPDSEEGAQFAEQLAAIQALEDAGDPLRLGREAELPPAEGDRSVPLSALAGFGIGAAIAGLFLLFGELRRRPIRTAAQLAAVTGSDPLGALGPGDAARHSRRSGIFDIEPLAVDRASAIATRLALDTDNRPGTLAIASPMPDEGRTSLALGLAAAAAGSGVGALVVETDMRRPAFAELLGLEPGPGLSDYLAGEASPREVINAIPVARGGDVRGGADLPSFVCVTCGTLTDSPGGMLSSPRFATLIGQLRRVYDVVIFDAPALLPAPEAILVSEATDETLLVVRSGLTRRGELDRALGALSGVRKAGTVLTAAPHAGPGVRRLALRRGSRFAERRTRR